MKTLGMALRLDQVTENAPACKGRRIAVQQSACGREGGLSLFNERRTESGFFAL
jgi:hypothetical protein